MKWILVLSYFVLKAALSRTDGQVQLTVDISGDAKTSVNVIPKLEDFPSITNNEVLLRKKRAPQRRPAPLSVGSSSDYTSPTSSGMPTSNDYGSMTDRQTNILPALNNNLGNLGGPTSPPFRPPLPPIGGMNGGMGGMGNPRGPPPRRPPYGGPRENPRFGRNSRYQDRRCRGRYCRRNQNDYRRRRPGNYRNQYDDYNDGGSYQQPGPRGRPIMQNQPNQRIAKPQGENSNSNYNYNY